MDWTYVVSCRQDRESPLLKSACEWYRSADSGHIGGLDFLSISMGLRTLLPAALLLTAGLTGCRSVFDTVAWRAVVEDDSLAAVARPLHADNWIENRGWTPLAQLPDYPAVERAGAPFRWSHPRIEAALEEADRKGIITRAAMHDYRRRTRSPARAGRAATDSEVNSLFETLSRQDRLPGWNAAILWAHYDPRAASAAANVLARLVTKPPSYERSNRDAADTGDASNTSQAALDGKSKLTPPEGASATPPVRVQISTSMQAAAAEAWCLVLAQSGDDAESALAPAGRVLLNPRVPRVVLDELARGVARRVRPDRIPFLSASMAEAKKESPQAPRAVATRKMLIDACVVHAAGLDGDAASGLRRDEPLSANGSDLDEDQLADLSGPDAPWPADVWRLRYDADDGVRIRFGEFVAATGHPAALAILKGQLRDREQRVRDAAFVALGILGTPAARAALEDEAKRAEERTRMLAVRGLSCYGPRALAAYATDKSSKVRGEMARGLERYPGHDALRLLGELLADASLEAQSHAVLAVRDWPDSLALPLWLQAMSESSLKTRRATLELLEDRRGGGLSFPIEAGARERALRAEQWSREWNLPELALVRVRELARKNEDPAVDPGRLAELRERLADIATRPPIEVDGQAAAWARELRPEDAPALEVLLESSEAGPASIVRRQVLPRLSEVHDALTQLDNPDVSRRRTAASRLARLGGEASLSPAAARRLTALLKDEQDGLVWRSAMQAIAGDGAEEAGQIVLLALNSTWPDVRVLGCEHVGRHGQHEQAPWLLPLLTDGSRVVQLAAISAAGQCRNSLVLDGATGAEGQPALRGLRALLPEATGALRFAIIVSMSRLGDPQGMEELTRRLHDDNAPTRLEVVRTMGQTGQTRFVEPLIRMAWTERDGHVRQAALASLAQLVPATERPPALANSRDAAHAVEIWTAWWEDRIMTRASGHPAAGKSSEARAGLTGPVGSPISASPSTSAIPSLELLR